MRNNYGIWISFVHMSGTVFSHQQIAGKLFAEHNVTDLIHEPGRGDHGCQHQAGTAVCRSYDVNGVGTWNSSKKDYPDG
jgi:hypothetical protein